MDLIWDWLSKNIEPTELTPSGQHVLQEIRNIWQQQNRDHLAEWERNISQSQATRQVSSTNLWTLQEIKPIENHQIRYDTISQYEDCGSSASEIVTKYSPAGKLDTREEIFEFSSPSELPDADEGLHLSLAPSPVWPPLSCDIFSDCGAPATENSASPMEVEAVLPVIIPETYEECRSLSSPDYQSKGLPRGFVASGNISREEIDDINGMFAAGDEFFQDILEYEDNKETRPTFGNVAENEVIHTSKYFRQPQEQSVGSLDLSSVVPFKNETVMCEKEISCTNIKPSFTPLSSGPDGHDIEVFIGESLPSVPPSDVQNEPTNEKFISSVVKPVQHPESLFQLPMREGSPKCMTKSVKNIPCAETFNSNPVQQSEFLFQLPVKKGLSKYMKKSVKNIPSAKTFNPGETFCNDKKSLKDTATHLKTWTIPDMFSQKKKRESKTNVKESLPQRKKFKDSDPHSKIIDKSKSDEGNCNKNMQKFKAPFKKENSGLTESNSMDVKSGISSNIKYHITELNQDSLPLLEKKLANEKLLEVGLTITYRNGFCQLNQCIDRCKFLSCTPAGIMISLNADDMKPEYLYLSLDVSHWHDLQLPRTLISQILKCHCRKICFKSQEIILVLIKIFKLHRREVSMDMILLDSMVGCWLLDPDHPVYDFPAVKTALGFNKNKTLSNDPQTKVCQLLQQLSKVMELLYQKLEQNGLWRLFVNMEMKIIPILADMECHGIRVERKILEEMGDKLKASLKILQESAYKIVGKQFQLNSTLQLRKILYEDLKLDEKHHIRVKETNTTGAKSTSEPMLQLLKPLHPLPGIILEYRHLQKVKSTYVEAILQHINGEHIFSTWELTSAATGRITSSNPNLQALPKQPISVSGNNSNPLLLRSPYLPHKDFIFVAADFQHIELRVFAHFSQDPSLLTIFQQPGDIFYYLAQKWLHKSEQPIGIEEREKTKRIVYSVMYGAGPSKLAEFLHIDKSEANQIINSFINHFPSLRTFSRRMTEQCREKGLLQTISGRHRLFPNICSSNPVVRAHTERQAINFVIQGSAADICKAFMLHTEYLLSTLSQIEAHLVLQVHDELVWEVKDVQVDTFRDMIQGVLEDTSFLCKYIGTFSVPLSVTITMGRDLANMKIDLLSQNFYSLRSQ